MKEKKISTVEDDKLIGDEVCFVIMPFSEVDGYEIGHFSKVYEQIFKPAIIKAGFIPERVDEDLLSTTIISKIYKKLMESPMVLCDLSTRNSNVFYELGIRHAYDKPVVLVKDDITKYSFDVAGMTTIEYQSNRLYENVLEAIDNIYKAIIEHTKEGGEITLLEAINIQKASISSDTSPKNISNVVIMNEINKLSRKIDSINNYEVNSDKVMIKRPDAIDSIRNENKREVVREGNEVFVVYQDGRKIKVGSHDESENRNLF